MRNLIDTETGREGGAFIIENSTNEPKAFPTNSSRWVATANAARIGCMAITADGERCGNVANGRNHLLTGPNGSEGKAVYLGCEACNGEDNRAGKSAGPGAVARRIVVAEAADILDLVAKLATTSGREEIMESFGHERGHLPPSVETVCEAIRAS